MSAESFIETKSYIKAKSLCEITSDDEYNELVLPNSSESPLSKSLIKMIKVLKQTCGDNETYSKLDHILCCIDLNIQLTKEQFDFILKLLKFPYKDTIKYMFYNYIIPFKDYFYVMCRYKTGFSSFGNTYYHVFRTFEGVNKNGCAIMEFYYDEFLESRNIREYESVKYLYIKLNEETSEGDLIIKLDNKTPVVIAHITHLMHDVEYCRDEKGFLCRCVIEPSYKEHLKCFYTFEPY